jgi:nucleoside-diphosphate-sugar epimerase
VSTSVLLTGAYGNIGLNCLKSLLQTGHRVTTLDLENTNNRARAAEFGSDITPLWGDICDEECVQRALQGIDVVVHLAAIFPPVSETNPGLAQRVNVDATDALIRLMEASGTARRLILASSMAVYGDQQQSRTPPLTANSDYAPHNVYARTKVANEKSLKQSTLDWSILRISACPPVNADSDGDPSVLFNIGGSARIEFIHPSDTGLAFANAVTCDDAIGKILLIGGGKSCQVTGMEFVNAMLIAKGVGALPVEALNPDPTFDGDWLDTGESQRLLKFQHHNIHDYGTEVRRNAGWRYWLIRLMAPLARKGLMSKSPHLKKA